MIEVHDVALRVLAAIASFEVERGSGSSCIVLEFVRENSWIP